MADISPAVFMEATGQPIPDSLTSGVAEEIDSVPENRSNLFCEAPGCNTELVYAGRGRRPKFCPDHKSGGAKTKTDKPPTSTVPRGINKIRDDVRELLFTTGVMISPYDQYDGAVLVARAEPTADMMALLASRYPKFRAWLDKGGDGMMWVKVAMTCAAIGIPIGAHHGFFPMNEQVAYKRFVDPKVEIDENL